MHSTEMLFKSVLWYLVICFLVNGIEASHHDPSFEIKQTPSSAPNVIIFFADDLGYGDLGFLGHPTSRTPNIDALAAESRILTHFYVTSPVCSPSRASLLTGRYQVRSGTYPGVYLPPSPLGLPSNETTIAKLLKSKGYKTQIVGKWHLGIGLNREFLPSNPAYGFDNYLGIPHSQDMCPCPICFPEDGACNDTCWDVYVSCPLFDNLDLIEQPTDLTSLTSKLVSRAVDFISDSKREDSPFFLYFPFHHIHEPQFASSEFYGKNARGATGDALLELDSAVGTVVKLLKEVDLLADTLIWFTSDNGPSMIRHENGGSAGLLRCGKGTTWDGGIRVPSFVHWPSRIQAGKSNALTSSLDILPTISSLVGADTSHLTLDGVDISNVLFDGSDQSPRDFYAVYPEVPTQEIGPFVVYHEQYKVHFYTQGSALSDNDNYDPMCPNSNATKQDPPLLFDLHKDPGERYNLGEKDEYRKIIARVTEWRKSHMANMTWMVSRTEYVLADRQRKRALLHLPADKRAQTCCTHPFCNPWPTCCDCVV